jgi:uncharacterized radical SAM superfamily protein
VSRTVECFYPGQSFPSISVTGTVCALDCKHCARKYLDGMIPAQSPDDLVAVAEALVERGASGFLLSGGVDDSGRVPLAKFASAIQEIKRTTDLKINAHIGLTPRKELEALVRSGIDSFSVDVYGSDETIREVLGLRANVEDYFDVVEGLNRLGAPVSPHICVGIHAGQLKGESDAIARLKRTNPRNLILISLIPTRGTAYEEVEPPGKEMMLSVVREARSALPSTRLLLGCMRSKGDRSWEYDLIEAGLDGIVLPAPRTVEKLKDAGYNVKKRAECCAMI